MAIERKIPRLKKISLMAFLELVGRLLGDNNPKVMREIFRLSAGASLAAMMLSATSCIPVDDRRAGGGAFDDSPVGQALDANTALPDEDISSSRSFQQWREAE